jgi:hypothetical protein
MSTKKMTRQEEHDFYADSDNQTPQGPARRRTSKLSELRYRAHGSLATPALGGEVRVVGRDDRLARSVLRGRVDNS